MTLRICVAGGGAPDVYGEILVLVSLMVVPLEQDPDLGFLQMASLHLAPAGADPEDYQGEFVLPGTGREFFLTMKHDSYRPLQSIGTLVGLFIQIGRLQPSLRATLFPSWTMEIKASPIDHYWRESDTATTWAEALDIAQLRSWALDLEGGGRYRVEGRPPILQPEPSFVFGSNFAEQPFPTHPTRPPPRCRVGVIGRQ